MSITFTCSHCHHEYIKGNNDSDVVERFIKWYPKADIGSSKMVCETCYKICLRVLKIQAEKSDWLNYAMSN